LNSPNSFFKNLCYYLLAFVLPLLLIEAMIGLHSKPLSVPLGYDSHIDTYHIAVYIKPVIEGFSPAHVPQRGAPFSVNALVHPVNAHLDFAFAWAIGLVSGSYGLAVNLGWLFKTMLGGVTGSFALRLLAVRPSVALVFGSLYAVLPYVMNRGVWNYNLSVWMIPPICALVLLLLNGTLKEKPPTTKVLLLGFCFLAGFNDPYTAFFSAILLSIAIPVLLFGQEKGRVYFCVGALGLLLLAFAISLVPGLLAQRSDPALAESLASKHRTARHVVDYSLQILPMLSPVPHHVFAPFRSVSHMISTEAETARGFELGTFGAAGFIISLLVLALSALQSTNLPFRAYIIWVRPAAVLSALLCLFSTKYGLNLLVAVFLSPYVRYYDRMVTFIGFLSFFVAAALCSFALKNNLGSGYLSHRLIACLVLLGLLVAGAVDQSGFARRDYYTRWAKSEQSFGELSNFVTRIESRVQPGAQIHVPPMGFKSTLDKGKYLAPYLVSENLRWSVGHMGGPTAATEWRNWQEFELPYNLRRVALLFAGFDGVWLDKSGDPKLLEKALNSYGSLPGVEVIESIGGRFQFIDCSAARWSIFKELGKERYQEAYVAARKMDTRTVQDLASSLQR